MPRFVCCLYEGGQFGAGVGEGLEGAFALPAYADEVFDG